METLPPTPNNQSEIAVSYDCFKDDTSGIIALRIICFCIFVGILAKRITGFDKDRSGYVKKIYDPVVWTLIPNVVYFGFTLFLQSSLVVRSSGTLWLHHVLQEHTLVTHTCAILYSKMMGEDCISKNAADNKVLAMCLWALFLVNPQPFVIWHGLSHSMVIFTYFFVFYTGLVANSMDKVILLICCITLSIILFLAHCFTMFIVAYLFVQSPKAASTFSDL